MSDQRDADFSNLLDQIYDCVLQPERWDRVLASLCHELAMFQGVIGYYEAMSGRPLLRVQHGMATEWFDRMPEYGVDMASFWGGPQRILGYPLGEVIVHSVANPEIDERNNRFAREWCAPQGIVDMAAMTITGDQQGVGTLVFTSGRLIAQHGPDELELLKLLSPHLRRAITISRILDLRAIEADYLRAAIDSVPNGIVLVDRERRILYANTAAEAIIRGNDAFRVTDGMMAMRRESLDEALRDAVTRIADGSALSEKGAGIPAEGATGARCIVHVLPLAFGDLKRAVDQRAVAAIFLSIDRGAGARPTDLLRIRYDLTPSELRVCELVADGLTPAEIAARIGVAASTVRTHLHNIFAKTGSRRQAEIVRIMALLQRE